MADLEARINSVLTYHHQTKHDPQQFARSPGYLDWRSQPNPFRSFPGALQVALPLNLDGVPLPYDNIFQPNGNPVQELNQQNLSIFLEHSLGLSAWKATPGATWSLRINPSSGNLHPTEGYLILPDAPDLLAGIYHYAPYRHSLERRLLLTTSLTKKLFDEFAGQAFIVGLSSIYWRESWKYGERAYRYCNHDLGHALACLSISASLLGWKVKWFNQFSHQDVDTILGLNQMPQISEEVEEGDLLCLVYPSNSSPSLGAFPLEILEMFKTVDYQGVPSPLSREHREWAIINEVAANCKKERTPWMVNTPTKFPPLKNAATSQLSAQQIIKRRRSAVAMDAVTSITKNQLLSILDKTLPRAAIPPFDINLGDPMIHLVLFIHRVEGLAPGVYILVRHPGDLDQLKTKLHRDYTWDSVAPDFPLYQLSLADVTTISANLSCGQAIAGDGAFSLGMVANFEKSLHLDPARYPVLYWEAGVIGQVLYLQAEAHGVRATGIGCFFDDGMHEFIGLKDKSFQSIYHLTVGGAVDDSRLQTLPPYHHIK